MKKATVTVTARTRKLLRHAAMFLEAEGTGDLSRRAVGELRRLAKEVGE